MSDRISHECGISLIRLLRPLEYYIAKYGTALYGMKKLHLLMQKQHNRGQDGAGIANVKFDLEPGHKYIHKEKSDSPTALEEIFSNFCREFHHLEESQSPHLLDVKWLKYNIDCVAELYLGHLRYGTYGKYNLHNIHPFIRDNNWKTRTLALAGNFNLTNVDELFKALIDLGQAPVETSDTVTILEKIGHWLDEENEEIYQRYKKQGYAKRDISALIAKDLNIQNILRKASETWDGGYAIAGLLGHGDAFVMRDPAGIRPVYFYADDEVAVVTSEKPAIQTAFDVHFDSVKELKPGHVLIIKKNSTISEVPFTKPVEKRSCSFERIYFSRGTDQAIYRERKLLGKFLVPSVLKAVDHDLENTVFSYIPNTAIDAYYGMIEELDLFCDGIKKERILKAGPGLTGGELESIMKLKPRVEKVAVKDMKLRTFITKDTQRDDLTAHIYDITYGSIRPGIDNLVVLDDSIVRGTTLKQSIIRILGRLDPRKIIIASSAPQIRYPDCYGIDMANLHGFIAFRAAIELLRETRQENIINEVYRKAKEQQNFPKEKIVNYVKEIYKPFSAERLSEKISKLLTPSGLNIKVRIIFQTIEDLHAACPDHSGDWYFTGNYPTPGGNRVVNTAFINFIEKRQGRSY